MRYLGIMLLLALAGCMTPARPYNRRRQAPSPCTAPVAPIRNVAILAVINVNYTYTPKDAEGGRSGHRDDILEELNMTLAVEQQAAQRALPSDPVEAALLQHLSAEPLHVDEIGRAAAMPIATVSSTLTLMELKGLARHVGGMQYVRGRA